MKRQFNLLSALTALLHIAAGTQVDGNYDPANLFGVQASTTANGFEQPEGFARDMFSFSKAQGLVQEQAMERAPPAVGTSLGDSPQPQREIPDGFFNDNAASSQEPANLMAAEFGPQLLYSIQSAMYHSQDPYEYATHHPDYYSASSPDRHYSAYNPPCDPPCVPTITCTVETGCCLSPSKTFRTTHTVYASVETNASTCDSCHENDSDSECDDEAKHHKHHHHHHHRHGKKDNDGKKKKHHKHGHDSDSDCEVEDPCKHHDSYCETEDPCKHHKHGHDSDCECTTVDPCEDPHKDHDDEYHATPPPCAESTHKHHKHHKHHRHHHKHHHHHRPKYTVSEIDEDKCFDRAVLSVSSNDGNEGSTTIGKKLYQVDCCPTHHAYASVETAHCTCHPCPPHCTCGREDGYHTVMVSVHGRAKPTHTEYKSIESHPLNTHFVIQDVESGHIDRNTHTALEYVESHGAGEHPRSTHVVLESVASGRPSSTSHYHTAYKYVECHPKSKPTHAVIESVETGCCTKDPYQHTHTAYESVEKHCESKSEPKCCEPKCEPKYCEPKCCEPKCCEPKCEPKYCETTHTAYESVESHCGEQECHDNVHTAYESIEKHCEPKYHDNAHTVYQSVEAHHQPQNQAAYDSDSDNEGPAQDAAPPAPESCNHNGGNIHLANTQAATELDEDNEDDDSVSA
ncbi:hypothetical protein GGF46_001229 [Coemansia sp. RSA 552]|nr:hypothetical protein GGF46_001229 [Coemansia sp. RSA 552]